MRFSKPGLAGRLALVTILLITLAVLAVSLFGIRTVERLADAEALTRVELGLSTAREGVRQGIEELVVAVRVLSERPTLHRLLGMAAPDPLPDYLTRYCEGAAFRGCVVVRNDRPLAAVGEDISWDLVLAAADEQGDSFLVTGALPGYALYGARTRAAGHSDVTVVAVRALDASFALRLSENAGLGIEVVDFLARRDRSDPFDILDAGAIARGETVSARLPALGVYGASQPIVSMTGETIAVLHASLPLDQVMRRVTRMTQRILGVAVLAGALAIAAALLIGRYWIADIQRLTDAARRLGSGDLATAIPVTGGKEISVLASTMEEMRSNLVELTGELRRRESQAKAVLSGIVEGVYAVDQARRVRFLNPQAERLLQIESADAQGRFCGDILKPALDEHGQRPCEHACPILAARRTGSAQAVEKLVISPGRFRRVVISSAAASDGIQVQVLRDETELEAVRRTRDTVLANISHEFRTPLSAQLASIELLREGIGEMPIEAQRELVASLERGVQRLTWLIDNLLESVRIESGQLAIRNHELHLDEVVEHARELIGSLIEQRGQRIELDLDDELPGIRGDQRRLTQVMVNLLANASKFAPAASVIRIGASARAGGGLRFWVDDDGPGPPPGEDTALFERFHRAGGEDPEESGLGLGLYIVRSIVERHGGRVSLRPRAEGGTRAEVELPKEAPA
jgi:signal transduction histidine kinase/HAMP domain-containing protein